MWIPALVAQLRDSAVCLDPGARQWPGHPPAPWPDYAFNGREVVTTSNAPQLARSRRASDCRSAMSAGAAVASATIAAYSAARPAASPWPAPVLRSASPGGDPDGRRTAASPISSAIHSSVRWCVHRPVTPPPRHRSDRRRVFSACRHTVIRGVEGSRGMRYDSSTHCPGPPVSR